MVTPGNDVEAPALFANFIGHDRADVDEPSRCWDCHINFDSKESLHEHLYHHHIKQPVVALERTHLPPLKLTIKSSAGSGFEIVYSPAVEYNIGNLAACDDSPEPAAPNAICRDDGADEFEDAPPMTAAADEEEEETTDPLSSAITTDDDDNDNEEDQETNLSEHREDALLNDNEEDENSEPSTINNEVAMADSPSNHDDAEEVIDDVDDDDRDNDNPLSESTPPPQDSPPSSSPYPKIRIKTTGLLEVQPMSITEIIGDEDEPEICASKEQSWMSSSSSAAEDPLKLPAGMLSDDSSLMSLFNNNERAKDLGFTTSDTEFISSIDRLECLDDRNNRNNSALQIFNSPGSSASSALGHNGNSFGNLTGLPMEALAQQVSRLQPPPGGGAANGMHQQNVLINIQQFPQAPPPPPYHHQPPPMYHPQMYQPYQYQPQNPIYYPPPGPPPPHPAGYHHPQQQLGQLPPPPRPPPQQMPPNHHQFNHRSQGPSTSSSPSTSLGNPGGVLRQGNPRSMGAQGARMPMMQRFPMGGMMGRQPPRPTLTIRHSKPHPGAGGGIVRNNAAMGSRPRMHAPNGGRTQMAQVKRTAEFSQVGQGKKKKFDVLTPSDKDDEDCQVICMQPNNKDGALPQIQSVQGGTPEQNETNVMHLSDSITLSVRKRNPPPRPQSPKKSDTKAVANILATRGITVTTTPKTKDHDKTSTDVVQKTPGLPTSINLNGAVSIIPSSGKPPSTNNGNNSKSNPGKGSDLPTVDLTDDASSLPGNKAPAPPSPVQKQPHQRQGLPFKCDLCPAQYPNALGLSKHRQNYHKTGSGMCDIGIPLVNLKQPGIFQKLTSLGIFNYIPLPATGPEGTYALPIINARNANVAGLGTTTMLTLGPIRSIPKLPNSTVNNNINGHINHKPHGHK